MIQSYFESYICDLKATLDEIDPKSVESVIKILLRAREQDKQIFAVGNGGSAAAASHLACDLGKGTIDADDPHFKRFRVHSFADNAALMTAIGNDISYEEIFTEQLKNHLNPEDIVIAISASGNSPNVVRALELAQERGAVTIGLLGFGGGKAGEMVDHRLIVESRNYGIAEDFHLIINHVITQIIRRVLQGAARPVVFLDRDGVINRRTKAHQYITRWEDFEFLPGVPETLRSLNSLGYKLVVLTNQQGIGKGEFTESDLHRIHTKMQLALERHDVTVEKIYYCPHLHEDACECRKPNPGMLHRAKNELNFNLDFSSSFLIGDSESDIVAGKSVGVQTIYVGENRRFNNGGTPDHEVGSLAEALPILRRLRQKDQIHSRIKQEVQRSRPNREEAVAEIVEKG